MQPRKTLEEKTQDSFEVFTDPIKWINRAAVGRTSNDDLRQKISNYWILYVDLLIVEPVAYQ